MTLERLENGTHVFRAPERPYVAAQDGLGRTAQLGAPSTRPIGPVHVSPPVAVKNHGMTGYEVVAFQAKFYDLRGTWLQEGPFDLAHCNFAECSFVGDSANHARHAFKTNEDPATNGEWVPAAALGTFLGRMVWAFFAGKLFATMSVDATPGGVADPPVMYGETSVTDPEMAKVTTYALTGTHAQIMCMALVTTAGVTRLWLGYLNGGAPAFGIDTYADVTLATPVVVDPSNGHTGAFTDGVCGIIQSPNGDILIATTGGDLRIATNNTAALAAISFTTVQAQALGAFPVAVGNCALSNYAPGALWWCPNSGSDGGGLWFANGNSAGDQTPKGHLVLSTYDALQLDPIDFPDLPYVTFATIYRGGVVACDRHSHYWYTGKSMIPMDGGSDRPVDSHKTRLCCGHAVVGDKFVRIEAEIDDRFNAAAPNDDYNTLARVIEFDPYLSRERPISKAIDLGFGGQSLIVGAAPSFPFSPNTRNVHWFSIWEGLLATRNGDFGRWWRQYQEKNNGKGASERSTDQPATGGQEFEDEAVYESPYFTHPSLEGFEYTPLKAWGPRVEGLLEGGPDAYVDLSCGGYNADGAGKYRLRASEPDLKYPSVQFGAWPNRTWSTALQLRMESHQSSGYTHWTSNPTPIVMEVVARRPLPLGVRLS